MTALGGTPAEEGSSVETRVDPLTGDEVVIVGNRQTRPNLPADGCPFCVGGVEAPEPYDVRWFPNRWPPLPDGRAEVVLYAPEHDATLASLPPERVQRLVELWAERTAALGARPDVDYVLVFENRGAEVGATIAHPHGQIYAFDEVPPVARAELLGAPGTGGSGGAGGAGGIGATSGVPVAGGAGRVGAVGGAGAVGGVGSAGERGSGADDGPVDVGGAPPAEAADLVGPGEGGLQAGVAASTPAGGASVSCVLCSEQPGDRLVAEVGVWRAWVPAAASWPYGLVIAPTGHVPDLPEAAPSHADLAALLVDVFGRLDRLFDEAMPLMWWWHQRPTDGGDWPGAHVHAHVAPLRRAPGVTRYVAAAEQGAGILFNPVPPETAAAHLRDA